MGTKKSKTPINRTQAPAGRTQYARELYQAAKRQGFGSGNKWGQSPGEKTVQKAFDATRKRKMQRG